MLFGYIIEMKTSMCESVTIIGTNIKKKKLSGIFVGPNLMVLTSAKLAAGEKFYFLGWWWWWCVCVCVCVCVCIL